MPSREEPMKIYGVPMSVHTRKVILSARIKSIPYVSVPVVPVDPDNPPSNWRSISPAGLIPAIDDGGYVLADSTAIVLYLERRSQEPALLPRDAGDYGRALFLDSWAGSELGTPQDITAQEIRLECFFPLDRATAERARQLTD